jgi:hypothetical protein
MKAASNRQRAPLSDASVAPPDERDARCVDGAAEIRRKAALSDENAAPADEWSTFFDQRAEVTEIEDTFIEHRRRSDKTR